MPAIVSIVGHKNAGKTTLIERLVPELRRRGWRVGTVKHDVHGFRMDYPGKDTDRHFQAGAEAVLIFSDRELALRLRLPEPTELARAVQRYMADVDIVLAEGFHSGETPKIEVWRPALGQAGLRSPADRLIAVAADPSEAIPWAGRRLPLNDPAAVADFIEQTFLTDRPAGRPPAR